MELLFTFFPAALIILSIAGFIGENFNIWW